MPAANTKHTWLAAIAAPILRQLPDSLRMPPLWKIAWKQVPNLFRNTVSITPVASARRQASPSFSSVQAVSNRRPDIVRALSEARLANHISSLRRTACRPKSVRLHAFHAALVVDGCGIFCGGSRWLLRHSCGKHRWPLRHRLRQQSWMAAAFLRQNIVEACGECR